MSEIRQSFVRLLAVAVLVLGGCATSYPPAPTTINREHGEAFLQRRKHRRPAVVIGRGAVDQHEGRTLAASPHDDRRPVLRDNLPRVCAHRAPSGFERFSRHPIRIYRPRLQRK